MNTTKAPRPAKIGERYRVKSTPITREFGFRVFAHSIASADNKAWPGEIGVVVEHTWTAHNGEPMRGLWLEFSRGRKRALNQDDMFDADDAADLVRLP